MIMYNSDGTVTIIDDEDPERFVLVPTREAPAVDAAAEKFLSEGGEAG